MLQYLLLFYVLVFGLQGMWALSSLTQELNLHPCIGRQSLSQWTAREVLAKDKCPFN